MARAECLLRAASYRLNARFVLQNAWTMRIRTLSTSAPLFGACIASAQFTITPAPTNQQIGELLEGLGVTILNVDVQCGLGPPMGTASFTGSTTLPFEEGIVLATGFPQFHVGSAQNLAANVIGSGSDPDLVAIAGAAIYDRCVLEFDCIPDGDTLMFSYVFASEEYPEYVCAINDVFGLFVSGPGLFGPFSGDAVNLACIPGTNEPVGINTVHGGRDNNPNDPMCPAQNLQYYLDNTWGLEHVFDGHTTGLLATTVVAPGQLYHFKLAVGDALDNVFDSAVFLKAFSFRSTGLSTGLAHQKPLKPLLLTEPEAMVLVLPDGHGVRDVQVFSATGMRVAAYRVAGDRVRVPTAGMSPGMHLVRFFGDRAVAPVRFVVE